jgi:two-component system, NarL family, sensor kinase
MIEHEIADTPLVFPFTWMDSRPLAAYLYTLLESSPIAIVLLDAQHRYTMCNPAFVRLFQYTPAQLAGMDLDALLAGPEMTEQATQLTHAVLQGNKVQGVTRRRRRDGAFVDVEVHGIPLFEEGRLAGAYGLYQDVTERNKAQLAFREISDQLDNLQQRERRRLARDLHDSTAQELTALNWNLARLSNLVCDQSEAIRNLVHQTKEIACQCSAKIRSASYLLHPPLLGQAGLALAVPRIVEGFEKRSGIGVKLEMGADLGRFSDQVEIAIYRVLQEGLANVLRHSDSTEVCVSLYCTGEWLRLVVRDCGHSPARGVFHRASSSGKRERLELLSGSLSFEFSDTGATLEAAIPLEA